MSNTQNFAMWGEVIGNQYNEVENVDMFPFHNQWRGRPLQQGAAYIRNNTAGWYPYPKAQRNMKTIPEPEWKYTWYYPCNTIFPSNPQFLKNRTIILER